MTKLELCDLIRMHKPQYEILAIDCLFAGHGHTVTGLPPFHPDLNSIENIWVSLKTRIVAQKNNMLLLSCDMFDNWQRRISPL